MSTTEIIVIAVAVLLVAIALVVFARVRRTQHLRHKFGPEYARAVGERGGAAQAERALAQREKRVGRYDLKPLSSEARQGFEAEWAKVQALFVDSPTDATAKADDLLGRVMSARGYPEGPFDQRLEDLSV